MLKFAPMTREVAGVNLEIFEDPTRVALKAYEETSRGFFEFETDKAPILEPTPNLSNSARSVTMARYKGKPIGNLVVIAFKLGDGTGKESEQYNRGKYKVHPSLPAVPRVVPRSKTDGELPQRNRIHSEAHLALLTHKIDDAHAEPELFDGSLDLIGVKRDTIQKIGVLGGRSSLADETAATLTVGYNQAGRFGDPHAVFNSMPGKLQVCAFLAITFGTRFQQGNGDPLAHLHAQEPAFIV